MSRILVTKEESWYDELSLLASYYETQFENIILQYVNEVFPDYYTIPYKKSIKGDGIDPKVPDLSMIRKDLEEWYIVEIELSDHTIEHVLGQVTTFKNGDYNPFEVESYINKKMLENYSRNLNKQELRSLIREKPPEVLVIVDKPGLDWGTKLKKVGSYLCVFEIYKNLDGELAYRLEGEYPKVFKNKGSHCTFINSQIILFEILEPELFDFAINNEITILYNGRKTSWKVVKNSGRICIQLLGKRMSPFTINNTYVLKIDSQNNYHILIN